MFFLGGKQHRFPAVPGVIKPLIIHNYYYGYNTHRLRSTLIDFGIELFDETPE